MKRVNRFPKGWNAARVARVLAHYEAQREDEAVAEDEAGFAGTKETTMRVPVKLVPKVRELIARQRRRGRAA
jgi:hypothetical protein